jgi:hypothetical protein
MGRAGVSMTKSPFGGELDLARTGVTRSDHLHAGSIHIVASGLTWTVENTSGIQLKYASAAVGFGTYGLGMAK